MSGSIPLIGDHPQFVKVVKQAEKLASVSRHVMIRSERGTGKELIARHLHLSGERREAPFVTVNCGAVGGDLLRSELFGHEKGSFTGATEKRIGKLEQADGGTLFLDEIGNMSPEFQEKILRVAEYQEFERTGGGDTIKVDVRIIGATNSDLEVMISDGDFRADLYDRLSFAILIPPPLRERRSDIPLLIEYFARSLASEMPAMEWRSFSQEALAELVNYYWPGNVRQLKNVIEYLYIMSDSEEDAIMPSELPKEIFSPVAEGVTFEEKVEVFQKGLLINALRENDGNQKQAADSLSLTYDKFRHLYKKFELKDLV